MHLDAFCEKDPQSQPIQYFRKNLEYVILRYASLSFWTSLTDAKDQVPLTEMHFSGASHHLPYTID